MILTSLNLKNFRIHSDLNLTFSAGLNYIIGGNGIGKTSVLESIYYLCTTKSCVSRSDQEALRFEEDQFLVEGKFFDLTKNTVRVTFNRIDNKKQFYMNEKLISKASSVIGQFPVVTLLPSDHSITQGAPSDRRKFFDSILSQANPNYLETLLEYNRVLKQRAALLAILKESYNNLHHDELNAWTEKLVEKGADIINYRISFTNKFKAYVAESYKRIMGIDEIPEIHYLYFDNEKSENIAERLHEFLKKRKEEEIKRTSNLVGPHRDDYEFLLGDRSLKTYGSQGQHKTFQTVLKFAEFFYLKDVSGKTPIFLLDDVFGELDSKRASKISEYLGDVGQAIITLTDFGNFAFLKTGEGDNVINLKEKAAAYA
ncbi:MAG: DNA replication and repair protein RecF [Salegentibacter mishustinae]|nr:DNA replication and repair protein RecF [Salegentibacter mishustinae]